MAVELRLDDQRRGLVVTRPISQTAVHEVAASDRARGRVLLRLVLPDDAAGSLRSSANVLFGNDV